MPAQAAKPQHCFGNQVYTPTLTQTFTDTDSWRQKNGGLWDTQYAWGRQNPGAHDEAYYMDKSLNLGNPVYDPFSISHKALYIEAQQTASIPGLNPASINNAPVVSGMLSTAGPNKTTFTQRYGYYELSAKLPKGQGFWTAFWMLDAYGGGEEIDVFEVLNNDTSSINQGVHGQWGSDGGPYDAPFDASLKYHKYGVLVQPGVDTFYLDGKATRQTADVTVGNMYFLVTFQIGAPGSWPGPPDSTTPWPSYMQVRYFTAYTPTSETCTK